MSKRSKQNVEYWQNRTNKLFNLDPKYRQVKHRYDTIKLLLQEKYPQVKNQEIQEDWGEHLEELINDIRKDGSTDSVHIHDFVRNLIAEISLKGDTIQMLKDTIYLDRELRRATEGEESEEKQILEEEYLLESGYSPGYHQDVAKLKTLTN